MAFSVLLLGHVITDYLLQPEVLVRAKRLSSRRLFFQPYTLIHVMIFLAVTLFLGAVEAILDWRFVLATLSVTILHYFIDYWKNLKKQQTAAIFLLDFLFHIISIVVTCYASGLWDMPASWDALISAVKTSTLPINQLTQVNYLVIFFVLLIWGTGNFVSFVVAAKGPPRSPESLEKAAKVSRRNALIGYMERLLILLFILQEAYIAIVLLLLFKALVRFEQLKDRDYAEYFIYGSMLSFTCGMLFATLYRYFYLYL